MHTPSSKVLPKTLFGS